MESKLPLSSLSFPLLLSVNVSYSHPYHWRRLLGPGVKIYEHLWLCIPLSWRSRAVTPHTHSHTTPASSHVVLHPGTTLGQCAISRLFDPKIFTLLPCHKLHLVASLPLSCFRSKNIALLRHPHPQRVLDVLFSPPFSLYTENKGL